MAQLILILFICIMIPLFLSAILFRGHSRLLIVFMMIGCYTCLFSGYLSGYIQDIFEMDQVRMTYTINPLVEELAKAIPVIIYGKVFKPKLKETLECAMIVGIGFAILENTYYLINYIESVTIIWAIIRGIGAGLMHGVSTLFVGWVISYTNVQRRLLLPGVLGALSLAILYHGTYNMLIQSDWQNLGIVLPLLTFIPIRILYFKINRAEASKSKKQDAQPV